MWFYLKRIVFFTLVSALSAWIMNLINNRMTYRIVRDLRSQAIRHIQVLPLSYLDQHSSGDIVSRVIADTDILSDGLLLGFTQLFSGIVTIIVTLFFHVLEERMDHPSCDLPDTSELLRGKIYFRPLVQNVPETE